MAVGTTLQAIRLGCEPVPAAVRALRGATTLDNDNVEQVNERVQTLIKIMLERNGLSKDDLISILFTATDDIRSMFPATAARGIGLGDVPLICARELEVINGTRRCVRILMHVTTERSRADLHHVYLEGAKGLRDDLPE
jgi:chorismate mutase